MNKLLNIPLELRQLDQWILHNKEKLPYTVSGDLANVTDPRTWSSFNNVVNVLSTNSTYAGVGFVFSVNDPYAGIDLDHSDDPAIVARQLKVFKEFDSYSERSPSGKGCHIIVKADIPHGGRRDKIEIYSSGRYFTMTGDVLKDAPIADRHDLSNQLLSQISKDKTKVNPTVVNNSQSQSLADEDVIRLALTAKNGLKFEALHNNSWQGLYPSASEAVYAYIDILQYYSGNADQIRRIFLASALSEDKYIKRPNLLNDMINKSFDKTLTPIAIPTLSEMNGYKAEAKPEVKAEAPVKKNSIELPPGLMGEIARYTYSVSPRPIPDISILVGLTAIQAIGGDIYTFSKNFLNTYICLIADSGIGKNVLKTVMPQLIKQTGLKDAAVHFALDNLGSAQGVRRHLSINPCSMATLDEFGSLLEAITSKKTSTIHNELKNELLKVYSASEMGLTVYSDASKNIVMPRPPALSLIGLVTPEVYYHNINENLVNDGFLSRFMNITITDELPFLNRNMDQVKPTDQLLNWLRQFITHCVQHRTMNTPIVIGATPEAREWIWDYDTKTTLIRRTNEPLTKLYSRAGENISRVAASLAVSENFVSPCVTVANLEWARSMIEREIEKLRAKFMSEGVGLSGNISQQYKLILNEIKSYYKEGLEKALKVQGCSHNYWNAKIIPYEYIRIGVFRDRAFAGEGDKYPEAIKKILQMLIDGGMISRLDRIDVKKMVGSNTKRTPDLYQLEDWSILND